MSSCLTILLVGAGHGIHGPSFGRARPTSTGKHQFYFANSGSPGLSPDDAIDLDAYRSPTPSTSDAEKQAFNNILGKIMAKQTNGDLVVAKELLHELSRVLYDINVESEMGHIIMEDRNYIGWKSSDSECPNFSYYLVQIQILVTFLERPPAAKHRQFIDLVNELSGSPTCGWDPSWNQDQQVCLNSYITFKLSGLPDKTLVQHGSTSSLVCAFFRSLYSDNSKGRCHFCRQD
jgi:hypothetical protein